MTIRVLLAGEGKSELGSRSGHPAYQTDETPGVLEVLLRRVRAVGWEVAHAREWKSVRQLQVGIGTNDQKRVLALALDAVETNCSVLAFTRDRDNDLARVAAVREGVEKALSRHEIEIVGRVAVPLLEGWVLALRGERGTEALSPGGAKARLREVGIGGAAEMAEEARAAVLADVPPDAESLLAWLADARRALEASETVE